MFKMYEPGRAYSKEFFGLHNIAPFPPFSPFSFSFPFPFLPGP